MFNPLICAAASLLCLGAAAYAAAPEAAVKIGVVAPFSGPFAEYGRFIREGLELAKEELGSNPEVSLIYEDDACSGRQGVAATRKLIELDRVPAIIGSWCSSVVLAQAPLVSQKGILQLAIAISPQIRGAGEFVYRIQPDAAYYLERLAPFLVKVRGLQRWAVLHIINDFGNDQAEVFAELVKRAGGRIVFSDGYLPETADFRLQLQRIKAAGADGLFLPGYTETALILRQAQVMKLRVQCAASVPFENADILRAAGSAAEGVFFPSHFDAESKAPVVVSYQERYFKRYGHYSEGVAVIAYDGLKVLAGALAECGSRAPCAKARLDAGSFQSVNGEFRFDEYGDVVMPIVLKMVRHGRFTTIKLPNPGLMR